MCPNKSKLTIPFDTISDTAPYRVVNIGNSNSINLLDYIKVLEIALGIEAEKNFLGMQNGELVDTYSNTDLLRELTGFKPKKELKEGILEFVEWYKAYYLISKI